MGRLAPDKLAKTLGLYGSCQLGAGQLAAAPARVNGAGALRSVSRADFPARLAPGPARPLGLGES